MNLGSAWILLAVCVGVLYGCGNRATADPKDWFIESYDSGVITVRHEGNTYKATCAPLDSVYNLAEPRVPQQCDTAIGLVGHGVQPFEGKHRDSDGRLVIMWSVGGTLALQSVKGEEKTSYRHEEFKITSVTPH